MERGNPFNSESAKEARAKAAPRGESKLKKLFKEYADADDVKQLFEVLRKKAVEEEDLDAAKLLLSYLIGKPRETVDMNIEAGVQLIFKKADHPQYDTK